jgi:hypothetical protein
MAAAASNGFSGSSAFQAPGAFGGPVPLREVPFYVTAGNVRRHPEDHFASVDGCASSQQLLVIDPSAVGREGDLVFGLVTPVGYRHLQRQASVLLRGASQPDGPHFVKPTHVVDAQHRDMYFHHPFYALVPLGNRESSTHVSGSVPNEGILRGRDVVHWIAGESGLVGVLMCEGATANRLSETSVSFELLGVLKRVTKENLSANEFAIAAGPPPLPEEGVSPVGSPTAPPVLAGTNINILDIVRKPIATEFTLPIVCIAGTSAEAGKTTLASKIISILIHEHHLRVGCVKATGTGGLPDCDAYRAMGATVVFDQVDAGLPTTYTEPDRVEAYLPRSFLLCQDAGVDVVVAELGGDIIWANNPTFLQMSICQSHVKKLFVICNDTMAAIGAKSFFDGNVSLHRYQPNQSSVTTSPACRVTPHHRLCIDASRIVYVASPFRNMWGTTLRAAAVDGMPLPLDPNDMDAVRDEIDGIAAGDVSAS